MGWGTSDVEAAQKLANEANLQMNAETNQWNYDIAHEANLWNWSNLQAQNEWNIQQWNRENEYNDPSAQIDRFVRAGINPIFAMGQVDAGKAQHLESGTPQPAIAPTMQAGHVEPEYDPYMQQRLGNIISASRDLMNAGLGFKELGIKEYNAETSRAAQLSQADLNRASAIEKAAATRAIEVQTDWNLSTFDVRCEAVANGLKKQLKELDLMDKQSDLYISQKQKIDAEKEFISQRTNRIAEDYQLKWKGLDIAREQARASMMSAQAQQQQAATATERLAFDKDFAEKKVQAMNNEQRLEWLKAFSVELQGKGEVSGQLGSEYLGYKVGGKASIQTSGRLAQESILQELGYQAIKDFAENPTPENAKVASEATKVANEYIENQENNARIAPYLKENSSNTSVLNPSFDVEPYESFGSRSPFY